jgi:pimeloyl-ACP methyl ester carboxylesterase
MPYFPLVASMIFWKEKQIGQKVENFALKETASKITCPVLLIQGGQDKLTPVEKAEKTYRVLGGPKALWVVPKAGHLSCWREGGQAYVDKLTDFYNMYL